jgi:Uncharacterized protein conserved in bacteria (DUF2188)
MKFRVRSQFLPYTDPRSDKPAIEREQDGTPIPSFETKEEAIAYATSMAQRGARPQVISMDVAVVAVPVEVKDLP